MKFDTLSTRILLIVGIIFLAFAIMIVTWYFLQSVEIGSVVGGLIGIIIAILIKRDARKP